MIVCAGLYFGIRFNWAADEHLPLLVKLIIFSSSVWPSSKASGKSVFFFHESKCLQKRMDYYLIIINSPGWAVGRVFIFRSANLGPALALSQRESNDNDGDLSCLSVSRTSRPPCLLSGPKASAMLWCLQTSEMVSPTSSNLRGWEGWNTTPSWWPGRGTGGSPTMHSLGRIS